MTLLNGCSEDSSDVSHQNATSALLSATPAICASDLPSKSEVLSAMRRVNDYWIANHIDPGDRGWARATYFEGNMAMYRAYPERSYLDYTLNWAEGHDYSLYTGVTTRHADNQNIGQTYIDLYRLDPEPERIADIDECISGMLATEQIDDWWWVDALYMAMPVFAKLAVVKGDSAYSERMYEMYDWTKRSVGTGGLYNTTEHLWWRDASYQPPVEAPNGENLYWSRGNGWAIAAHARVIEELDKLPEVDPHRAEYLQTFVEMAEALAAIQQPSGFWPANLLDPASPSGPETSGTAFFTYAMAWGIRRGYLPAETYLPVVVDGWNALVTVALADSGKLGYIQPVGAAPLTRSTTPDDHYDFGVGAFLLAGSEVLAMAPGVLPPLVSDVNLALDGTATATSQQSGNEASDAIDNDLTTRWSAYGYPQSLQVDLGKLKRVAGVELAPLYQRPYRFVVEVRASTSAAWEQVVDASNNAEPGSLLTRTFSPKNARFVRLTVTGIDSSTTYTNWVSLVELRVLPESM